jgi:hypothetical protein
MAEPEEPAERGREGDPDTRYFIPGSLATKAEIRCDMANKKRIDA